VSRDFGAEDYCGGCAERKRRAAARSAGCWLFEGQRPCEEGDVRVTTAFTRLLRLPGASVTDVSFSDEGVVVTVGLRRRPADLLELRADRAFGDP
jgi:hypothetical protein